MQTKLTWILYRKWSASLRLPQYCQNYWTSCRCVWFRCQMSSGSKGLCLRHEEVRLFRIFMTASLEMKITAVGLCCFWSICPARFRLKARECLLSIGNLREWQGCQSSSEWEGCRRSSSGGHWKRLYLPRVRIWSINRTCSGTIQPTWCSRCSWFLGRCHAWGPRCWNLIELIVNLIN